MRKMHCKTAVVTGASRGIGKEIANHFAQRSYDVVIVSRHREELERSAYEIREKSGSLVLPFDCDVTDGKGVRKMFEMLFSELGIINVLVNNAGTNARRPLRFYADEDHLKDYYPGIDAFQNEVSVNLTGTYMCSVAAQPFMGKSNGSVPAIVNVSSIKGIEPTTCPGYGASKAGVIKLTRDFARAYAPHIRVNCVALGFIDTGMTQELPEEKKLEYKSHIPQGRFGTTQEAAKVVYFLTSDDSSYITGATIDVNGGYLMH